MWGRWGLLAVVAWALPPERLSQTGLYQDIRTKQLAPRVRFFVPQYPLWSDGAKKSRWVLLPEGSAIDATDPHYWDFPIGTRFWKEFAFQQRTVLKRVETRYMEKVSSTRWEFRTYLWNAAETEALVASENGVVDYYPIQASTYHDIPSTAQCVLCHRKGGDPVLGFEGLQLSEDRDLSVSEPALGLALSELIRAGKLLGAPSVWAMHPPKIPASASSRAVLGYLHANCGTCHGPGGTAMHLGLDLRHALEVALEQELPALTTTLNQLSMGFQIPGQHQTFRIVPGKPEQSALAYRMRPGPERMPPLGTKIVDAPSLEKIKAWIRSL